jgi:uncharacterized protein (TIRG00374 family)
MSIPQQAHDDICGAGCRLLVRRLFGVLAALAVVIVAILQWHALAAAISRLNRVPLLLLGAAVGLEVLSLSATAALQRRLLAGGGVHVRLQSLLALVWASNAVGASLPAGAAASTIYTYRHLTRRGTPSKVAGWLLVATGIVSFAALALLLDVGVQLRGLLSGCTADDALELVALTGAVVGMIVLLARISGRPPGLGRLARWLHHVTASPQEFDRTSGLAECAGALNPPAVALRGPAWGAVLMLGILNWVADGAVLAISLHAVGASIPWRGFVLAYGLSQLSASAPILPGSIGIAEGSLVVVLVCAGVSAPDALAATVMYRLASFWLQLPPGWAAWARLRRSLPFDQGYALRHTSSPGSLELALRR